MLKFQIGGIHFGFSLLLVCMMTGTVFCNICDYSEELMARIESWTVPVFEARTAASSSLLIRFLSGILSLNWRIDLCLKMVSIAHSNNTNDITNVTKNS
jgi:hypothetical protein